MGAVLKGCNILFMICHHLSWRTVDRGSETWTSPVLCVKCSVQFGFILFQSWAVS